MSPKKELPASSSNAPQWAPIIMIAVLACAVGALATWAIVSRDSGTVRPLVPSAPSAPAAIAPPDVSALPPAQAALTLGNWYYDRNDWPAAIAQYQQAIARGIDNADVRTDLGNAFRFNGDPQSALKNYLTARKQSPLHENSLINLAGLHSEVFHDDLKASELWREYLRRFPNSASAPRIRASLNEASVRTGQPPALSLEDQLKAAGTP